MTVFKCKYIIPKFNAWKRLSTSAVLDFKCLTIESEVTVILTIERKKTPYKGKLLLPCGVVRKENKNTRIKINQTQQH